MKRRLARLSIARLDRACSQSAVSAPPPACPGPDQKQIDAIEQTRRRSGFAGDQCGPGEPDQQTGAGQYEQDQPDCEQNHAEADHQQRTHQVRPLLQSIVMRAKALAAWDSRKLS